MRGNRAARLGLHVVSACGHDVAVIVDRLTWHMIIIDAQPRSQNVDDSGANQMRTFVVFDRPMGRMVIADAQQRSQNVEVSVATQMRTFLRTSAFAVPPKFVVVHTHPPHLEHEKDHDSGLVAVREVVAAVHILSGTGLCRAPLAASTSGTPLDADAVERAAAADAAWAAVVAGAVAE
jgi:hypothetical protein